LRHVGQDAAVESEHVVGKCQAPQQWDIEHCGDQDEHGGEHHLSGKAERRNDAQVPEERRTGDAPPEDGRAEVGEQEKCGDRGDD